MKKRNKRFVLQEEFAVLILILSFIGTVSIRSHSCDQLDQLTITEKFKFEFIYSPPGVTLSNKILRRHFRFPFVRKSFKHVKLKIIKFSDVFAKENNSNCTKICIKRQVIVKLIKFTVNHP